MNYLLTYGIWLYFGGKDVNQEMFGNWITNHLPDLRVENVEDFSRYIESLLEKYPREAVLAQMNLLDSHDTARFLSILNGRKDLMLLSVLFLMTFPGAPTIYYGDEIGLGGGKDPDNRKAFPWDNSKWDSTMLGFYQRCISMRKAYPALRDGGFKVLYAQNEVLAYLRNNDEEKLLVVLNRSDETRHVDIDVQGSLPEGGVLQHVLAKGEMVVQGGFVRDLIIAPISGVVLDWEKG
jgi:neopullulanase